MSTYETDHMSYDFKILDGDGKPLFLFREMTIKIEPNKLVSIDVSRIVGESLPEEFSLSGKHGDNTIDLKAQLKK